MSELASITVELPAAVVDRLRGSQSRTAWLEQAALELARRQCGLDGLEDWRDLHHHLNPINHTAAFHHTGNHSDPVHAYNGLSAAPSSRGFRIRRCS